MNRKFALAMLLASCVLLSSCKPKPIQGQVFVVNPSGAGEPLSGIQIVICDAKEADDFVKSKQTMAAAQEVLIDQKLAILQSNLNVQETIEPSNEAIINAEAFSNSPVYIKMANALDDEGKEGERLAAAYQLLVSRYGEQPAVLTSHYPQAYWNAWRAEQQDYTRIQQIRIDLENAPARVSPYEQGFYNEKTREVLAMRSALAEMREEIKTNEDTIAQTKTAVFYLSDFTPSALQISLADPEGNFEIENPRSGEKVFAKLVLPDSTSGFFWLVDFPPAGQKLILSNGNMFTVPSQTSR